MEPPNGNLLTSPLTRQQIDNARRTDTISSHFYNSRDYSGLDAEPLSADILSFAAQRDQVSSDLGITEQRRQKVFVETISLSPLASAVELLQSY